MIIHITTNLAACVEENSKRDRLLSTYRKSKDDEMNNNTRDRTIRVPQGLSINVISFRWLPRHILNEMTRYQKEELENTSSYYIIYYRGYFLKIDERNCDVPRSVLNGWKPNI